MFIKIVILVVIAACIGPFFIKGPDGKPLLSLDDLKPSGEPESVAPAPVTVYKWQDENGVWQFSSDPVDAEGAATMELDGNINIMPSTPVAGSADSKPGPYAALPAGVTTVAPDQIQEMMDTVNNLQETIDDRKAEIDKGVGP